ncbi:MAG: DNA methyltransferase [Caldimicrobium sp.]|nr:DNA methyltransferase [Caldimicrobium sp.]
MVLYCLSKLKFDLRDPGEIYLAQREIEALLGMKTEFIKTLSALFKERPFNLLDEEIIHLMSRLVYLGEWQGFLAKVPPMNIVEIVKRATFFREIYVIFESLKPEEILEKIGINIEQKLLDTKFDTKKRIDSNFWTQIFIQSLNDNYKLITVRFLPFQTLFEYATEIKKLPACVFRPKNSENWENYFAEKEAGVKKGLYDLFAHLKNGHYRSPHFGLGKNHIGDFVDWASTDLRKPFLHYLHKYKGKGDPRISRALINLLRVKPGDTILDPFAGSGTFIADAPTMGVNAIGIEVLNIGKMIAETKCNLGIDINKLRNGIIRLFEFIDSGFSKSDIKAKSMLLKEKIRKNTYNSSALKKIEPYLDKILLLKEKIDAFEDDEIKQFLLILLSQQVIEYSEKSRASDIITSFKSYVEDRYLVLYATQEMAKMLGVNLNGAKVKIIKGDSTNMSMIESESIDGILTSPPYFDALDYIGNNKISILILGLDEDLKWESTKNIYEAKHRDENKYETMSLFVSDKYFSISLPESSLKLIEILRKSRKMNKAEVVQNYLKMMKLSFEECYRILKKDKYYLMVVSKYHSWIINGKEEVIETSSILGDLGKSVGFKLIDVIEHGLSKADKGKIRVEDILVFQKK